MSRSEFAKATGAKLEKIRKARNITITNMANALAIDRVTYVKNENGVTIPNFLTLYKLADDFDISLDWFVLDEEPMHRSEKITESKVENDAESLQSLSYTSDIKELMDHMDKIPLLRYEILAQFHRFKEDHQALVEKSMKTNSGV
jgi:transcriptional regulator with XRE-family HTH domain